MLVELSSLSLKDKVFMVCLCFARKDISHPMYEKRKGYYQILADTYFMNPNSIDHYQDYLDGQLKREDKTHIRGGHKRLLYGELADFYEKYRSISDEDLDTITEQILQEATGKEIYYVFRLKKPEPIELEDFFFSPTPFSADFFREGQTVFIALDVSPDDQGIVGLGKIVGIQRGRNKTGVTVKWEVRIDRPILPEEFILYPDTFNIVCISPMTRYKVLAGIPTCQENKAVALVRAMIELRNLDLQKIGRLFSEEFMTHVQAPTQILTPKHLAYGEIIHEEKSNIKMEELAVDYHPKTDALLADLHISPEIVRSFKKYINLGKHLILTGPPGTGKTTLAERAAHQAVDTRFTNGYVLTTATSDWSTFDTIGGYMPTQDNQLQFQEGIVLRSIRENKWLIIDEINRADIDKAFGQLFTILSGKDVQLPFQYGDKGLLITVKQSTGRTSYFDEQTATYYVGTNWRILATMNTFDKNSLYTLSYAFMRRFAFLKIPIPDQDTLKTMINSTADLTPTQQHMLTSLIQLTPKPIGPAIYQEIIQYLRVSDEEELAEGICGLVIPQYEGATTGEILQFYKEFSRVLPNLSDRLKVRNYLIDFFDIKPEKFESIDGIE